jgi:hypothetical protein
VYWVSVGRSAGKSPLGRTRLGWKGNIMLNLKEFGVDGIDWTSLTGKGQLEGCYELGKESLGSIKCGEFLY